MAQNSHELHRKSYLTELDDQSGSDDDENAEEPEEVYGWDRFRYFPAKTESGSSEDTTLYERTLQVVKCLIYIVLFVLVVAGGVFSKATILLATSQLGRTEAQPYCEYNELENRPGVRIMMATIAEAGRLAWFWCIALAFCVPEVFTLLNAIYYCLFKKRKIPGACDLAFACLMEALHAAGLAVLFFGVLPEFNAFDAASICSFTCFVPTLLKLLSRTREELETRGKLAVMITGDVIVLAAQISCIACLSIMSNISERARYLLPISLLLASCRWWSNYVSLKSHVGVVRLLFRVHERLDLARGFVQGVIALVRVLVFICLSIGIIVWQGVAIEQYFNAFPWFFEYTVTIHEVNANVSWQEVVGPTNDVGIVTVNSLVIVRVLCVHVLASFVAYSASKFACRTWMQRIGFALPASLTVPATIVTIFVICLLRSEDTCALHRFLPDYLLFAAPKDFQSDTKSFIERQFVIWLLGLVCQVWVTLHIWHPHCERLADSNKLFVAPSYDSLVIDQSLMLNRRNDDANANVLETENISEESEKFSDRLSENLSFATRSQDNITRIYACATMWHELEDEMRQFISSILRLDICQCAMRFIQHRYTVPIDDYFELEVHIFFDDAFQCMHGCERSCNHDENETHLNDYVKTLIEVIKTAVEKLGVQSSPPVKYPAPYGGRLEWSLPGKNRLIVHLKDKNKIRHRKRWSQVMYMYYLLGFRLIDLPIHISRKAVIAANTYILTLDGDIDFQPNAVKVLLHRMKKDSSLGAACGRIHPVGSGPMVWFQKFEYAIGHWLQKSTEHVIGSVLCSPGCFSIFRAKALMEDNVMRQYATRSTEARHYVQYDQGEDRWLCTLVLQSGYRVEYSAASDSYTHAPETFGEFYNQRRRWIPSTIANIFDLLATSKETRKANENISWLYIVYQWILMGSTVLGPGTIFLMMVGALVAAFRIDNWTSFYYNLIPIVIFVLVCFVCKASIQLIMAAIISAFYGLIMIVVLVGIMIQIADDGWVAPSTILFFVVASQLVIAGLLHPREWTCLICGVIYYITVPSMYMLLIIYSLFNVNNVTWGTRESKSSAAPDAPQIPGESPTTTKQRPVDSIGGWFSRLFNCTLCTRDQETHKLDRIAMSLDKLASRLDSLEKHTDGKMEIQMTPDEESHEKRDEDDTEIEQLDVNSECAPDEIDESKDGNFLVSPHWIQDRDVRKGVVEFLSHDEEIFWKRLIEKYLYPLDEDAKQLKKMADALMTLRNDNLFKFFMINALFVLIVFLMQLKKDTLHFRWPLGMTYNITYKHESKEVFIASEFLQLEPIGCLFILGFVLVLSVQFVAMLFHRYDTFLHLLSNTSVNFNCCVKKKDLLQDSSIPKDEVKNVIEGLQRLAEGNANPVAPARRSTAVPPRARKTVHNLIENHEKRAKVPATFDTVFRQNLRELSDNSRIKSTGISQNVLIALEGRRSIMVAKRKSQFRGNNSDVIYESAEIPSGLNNNNGPHVKDGLYNYDNQGFEGDENDLMRNGISASRRSQVTFLNVNSNV